MQNGFMSNDDYNELEAQHEYHAHRVGMIAAKVAASFEEKVKDSDFASKLTVAYMQENGFFLPEVGSPTTPAMDSFAPSQGSESEPVSSGNSFGGQASDFGSW